MSRMVLMRATNSPAARNPRLQYTLIQKSVSLTPRGQSLDAGLP